MNRRQLFETALAVALPGALNRAAAQAPPDWGGPVLDIHLHPHKEPESTFAHIEGSGVAKAVLLTNISAEASAKAAVEKYPGRFVRFTAVDATKPDAADILRKSLNGGAIGMGELKSHVRVDGPEMRRIFDLAAELQVPVLFHISEVPQFPGEGVYNTPIRGLPAVLKAHPKTTFIGHADAFWANVSAEVPGDVPYPTGRIKPGGLTDRMLADHPNLHGDLSANSGRNALGRDTDFMAGFLARHQSKLMFGCDCSCRDGRGTGQSSQQPLIKGKCVARETLTALKQLTPPEIFRKITWENGARLLKIKA